MSELILPEKGFDLGEMQIYRFAGGISCTHLINEGYGVYSVMVEEDGLTLEEPGHRSERGFSDRMVAGAVVYMYETIGKFPFEFGIDTAPSQPAVL